MSAPPTPLQCRLYQHHLYILEHYDYNIKHRVCIEYAGTKPLPLNSCTQSYFASPYTLYISHSFSGYASCTLALVLVLSTSPVLYWCSIYIIKCSGNRPLPLNHNIQSYQSFPLYTTLSPRSMHTHFNAPAILTC